MLGKLLLFKLMRGPCVILCADDFGISPGVSDAILELIDHGQVDATSVMVNFPDTYSYLRRLNSCPSLIRVGWHMVLTGAFPLTKLREGCGFVDHDGKFLSYRELYSRAIRDKIDCDALHNELSVQWDAFEEQVGFSPQFVDGHHHVQQFPIIRNVLINLIKEKTNNQPPSIRSSGFPNSWLLHLLFFGRKMFSRNLAMANFGHSMKSFLANAGIKTNRYLLGSYDPNKIDFPTAFRIYTKLSPSLEDIFYCHPGHLDKILPTRDSLLGARELEFQWLRDNRLATTTLNS